jgi:ferric-dicitrate binding protein FerR (iron transport regulator)
MPPIDRTLLEKYMKGECSPQEESMVHCWLDENDVNDYPDVHKEKRYERKGQAGWLKLVKDFDELRTHQSKKNFFDKKLIWSIAAASTVLIVLSVYLYQNRTYTFEYEAKYQTTYGEIKRINLADGTTVTLNACSALEVAKKYNSKNRKVYLEGEAYFQVKHRPGAPFIVHTKKLSVTALGTSFDVSAFSDNPNVSVSLKEGKVLVKANTRHNGQNVVLAPGEGVICNGSTGLLQTKKFNPKVQLAWQRQIISFEDADMQEVVRKLERFYGVEIDIKELKPRHWQLTGEYKNQTLRDVLESLSFNYNLGYKIKGKEVMLYNP